MNQSNLINSLKNVIASALSPDIAMAGDNPFTMQISHKISNSKASVAACGDKILVAACGEKIAEVSCGDKG